MDYGNLTPGRGLDLLIATEVLSRQVDIEVLQERISEDYEWVTLGHYSTFLPTAIRMAFEIHSRGYGMEMFVGHVSPGAYCKFQKSNEERFEHYERHGADREQALAMAICIAALKVVHGDAE
jgi:hypothetical protein